MSWPWDKKEVIEIRTVEKAVIPDMSKYATEENLISLKKSLQDEHEILVDHISGQFSLFSKTLESLKKSIEEKKETKEEFRFFKGSQSSDDKYLQGFDTGFTLGLKMASQVDEKYINQIKNQTIQETLGRLNGNKTNH